MDSGHRAQKLFPRIGYITCRAPIDLETIILSLRTRCEKLPSQLLTDCYLSLKINLVTGSNILS